MRSFFIHQRKRIRTPPTSSCSSNVHNSVSVMHGVKKRRIPSSSSGVSEVVKKKEADVLSAMKEEKESVGLNFYFFYFFYRYVFIFMFSFLYSPA